jgi:hypothetical protein
MEVIHDYNKFLRNNMTIKSHIPPMSHHKHHERRHRMIASPHRNHHHHHHHNCNHHPRKRHNHQHQPYIEEIANDGWHYETRYDRNRDHNLDYFMDSDRFLTERYGGSGRRSRRLKFALF